MSLARVKAPTFAVFGTLVDWRSSLIREGEALGRARGLGCWAVGVAAAYLIAPTVKPAMKRSTKRL